jgi:hypothetical protein
MNYKKEQKHFKDHKYVSGPFLSRDISNLASRYAFFDAKRYPVTEEDKQSPLSHYKYADPFMETLLLLLKPTVEKYTGLTLLPTYSYYRTYFPGADLKAHTDRPECEISSTVCLGYNYEELPEDYFWGLWIKDNDKDIPVNLKPGDGVIYRGCEVEHWRDIFIAPINSWQTQVFLHYIDAKGPYYNREFDGRIGLGHPTVRSENQPNARSDN